MSSILPAICVQGTLFLNKLLLSTTTDTLLSIPEALSTTMEMPICALPAGDTQDDSGRCRPVGRILVHYILSSRAFLPHSRIAIALESLPPRIQVLYPSWKAVELELILQGVHQY